MQGILLIGMPYVGKSTIGRKVAQTLGFSFFDGDHEIEKTLPNRQEYLDTYGDDAYIEMEVGVITKLPTQNSVLAPGGSIIYSEDCKKYLKNCFKVYLKASFESIRKRVTNIDKRGIVKLKKLGLSKLYDERRKLFSDYCDISLDANTLDSDEISKLIAEKYCISLLSEKKKIRINFKSTNEKSSKSFKEALAHGLAPDKGLFVPDRFPNFSPCEISLMKNLSYSKLAFCILRQFMDVEDSELLKMCEKVYNFDIPIETVNDVYIARFDQGPSASFKDFAIQLLAQLMHNLIGKKNLTILTATSGDTGGAVASAFGGLNGVRVIILMPKQEITKTQRKQMTTCGKNITAVLVDGKFDDCQSLAKEAFAKIKGLSSANSINVGRLLPQIVYYFYVYSRIKADTFIVPSGNFGNLVAGAMAKKMGLPVRLVAAVNENDEFPKFLETGKYKPMSPSRKCISNAMNIGNPSNLARLFYLYEGRLTEKGELVRKPNMEKLKNDILSVSISDSETIQAIKDAYTLGTVIEPHGAVGWAAMEKLRSTENLGKIVVFETAHPAKFPEQLDSLNIHYRIPKSLSSIKGLKENYMVIKPRFEELKAIIEKNI